MFEDVLPSHKIGYLSPLPVIDNSAYEWYRIAPKNLMAVFISVGVKEFSGQEMDRVFAPLDTYLDQLMGRQVDLVLQAGTPLAVLMGIKAHDRMMAHIEARTGKPATSTTLSVTRAAAHLKMKKIALVNKWTGPMNKVLADFYKRVGVEVTGIVTNEMSPADFVRIPADDHMQMAYELGKKALRDHPEADGIYLGGGTWLSEPITRLLEQESGKHVICNQTAQMWDILGLLGLPRVIPGHNRLLSESR
jgi:maleate cis-trans isomerase